MIAGQNGGLYKRGDSGENVLYLMELRLELRTLSVPQCVCARLCFLLECVTAMAPSGCACLCVCVCLCVLASEFIKTG